MAAEELLATVPSPSDYSVSAELWGRLEDEIKAVSARIEAGEDLVPEDVKDVRKLKSQVDSYVTEFNKAMRTAQTDYKKLVEARLVELGFNHIEEFIGKKRQEQTNLQNSRIAYKMECLKELSDGLLERTKKLKDIPVSKELLPAFIARFPNVQSGSKTKDIKDWKPYFSVMSRAVTLMDAFFCDPKYEDAVLLPMQSGTIRELLGYVKDGKEEHLANVKVKFEEDKPLIRVEKLKRELTSKAVGIEYIKKVFDEMGDMDSLSDAAKQVRTEQAWDEIAQIVRLCNTDQ